METKDGLKSVEKRGRHKKEIAIRRDRSATDPQRRYKSNRTQIPLTLFTSETARSVLYTAAL